MSNLLLSYYWFGLLASIIIINQAKARRRRTMGPRVFVEPSQFLDAVSREKGLVIKGPKVLWSGRMYLARCGDYYYYTVSKKPLELPEGCSVQEAKQILL
jgi:hypothetical protein